MTSVTQLFKMVSANDYDGLNRLLLCKKTVDLNSYKSGQSLISRAIEVRAKECFDIIINNPNNYMLKNKNSGLNGLNKALEYFSLAPNSSNEYYLQKLLEKGVEVEHNVVSKVMDNPIIFQQLLNRIPNDFNNLGPILYESVKVNNMDVFNMLYQKIIGLNLGPTTNNSMHLILFENAICSSNIDVIEIIKPNLNWKQCKHDYPIIYHMIVINNKILFEYFYNLYEKLSEEELNQIPNIKNVHTIFEYFNYMFNDKIHDFVKESMEKIYKLPVKFNDAYSCVSKLFGLNILRNYYSWDYTKLIKSTDYSFQLIYWLLSNDKVKLNPWDLMVVNSIETYYKNSENRLRNTPDKLSTYKNLFKNVIYLTEHFNHLPNKQVKDKFETFYGKDNVANWDEEKKAFIEKLASTQIVVKKTKRTKKAPTNQDIEV